jgi:hypothetical protein
MKWRMALVFTLLLALLAMPALGAAPKQVPKAEVTYPTAVVSSPAFRDLPVDRGEVGVDPSQHRVILNPSLDRPVPPGGPESFRTDEVLQSRHGNAPAPSPLISFAGINNLAGVAPPDTQGDIGPNHYMQWVNLHLEAWSIDRTAWTATPAFGPITGNTIWASLGGQCASDNNGDPIVLWDRFRNRWVISQFSLGPGYGGPYKTAIAVSKTADPAGAWWLYCYDFSPSTMNDYPKFGVWPDGYYYTCNQFTGGGSAWGGAGLCVFEADKMINGDPTARQMKIDLGAVSVNYGGILPAHFEGTNNPPAGSGYFVEVDDSTWMSPPLASDSISLWKAHVDWTAGTFTVGVGGLPDLTIPVTDFTPLCSGNRNCVPQPGTSQRLDSLADRAMYRCQYRNFGTYEAMTFTFTVDAGATIAGIRWFELRKDGGHPDWYLYQEGTYAPADGKYRWMGSAGQDHMGNLCVGYSLSDGTSTYPSVAYAGRLAGDPAGTLPQSEVVLHAGAASQTGVNRWGDYSSMSIDPVDDCTFWYTQEYSTGGWNWATNISAFKFPACSIGPTGTLNGTVTDSVTSAPIVGAQVSATNGTITQNVTTGAGGTYSMTLPISPPNYSVTASAFGYGSANAPSIAINNGATTTQDFTLAPVGSHTIEFQAFDGTTTWPVYTKFVVTGDLGYPGATFWNNPLTGTTGPLTFVDGVTYSVTAYPVIAGYSTLGPVTVGPLAANTFVTFDLGVDASCTAPGYTLTGGFFEQFETWPPPGWTITSNVGGGLLWNQDTAYGDTNYTGGTGHAADVNSDANSGVPYDTELRTPAMNFSTFSGYTLTYKLNYQDITANDAFDVDISTDGGGSWTNLRHFTTDQGSLYSTPGVNDSIDLSAYAAQTNVMLRWHYYTSDASPWDWYAEFDAVAIGTPGCNAPAAGGIVVGQVNDGNTALPLTGSAVTNTVTSKTVIAAATPDPAVGDAFYCLYANAGNLLNASKTLYGADTYTTAAFPPQRIIGHNFALGSGQLAATPTSLTYGLPTNATGSQPLSLDNVGTAAVNWVIQELNGHAAPQGGVLLACIPDLPAPTKADLMNLAAKEEMKERAEGGEKGEKAEKATKAQGAENRDQLEKAKRAEGSKHVQNAQAAPGSNSGRAPYIKHSAVQSLSKLLPLGTTAYAMDVYPAAGQVVSFDSSTPGTFTSHGPATGLTPFAGDFYMGDTTKLFCLDYTSNNLVSVDTTTGAVTTIGTATPAGGESWSGMTCQNTGVTYVSSTSCSSSTLYTIDLTTAALTPIGTVTNAACLIDIAINTAGELYGVDIISDVLVKIDTSTGAGTVIGSIGFDANYAQGMDFDEATNVLYLAAFNLDSYQGELRTCDTTTGMSTLVGAFQGGDEVDCLAFTSFVPSDIPWLDEAPKSGTLPAAGNQPITVSYDSTGLATGAYLATLAFKNDSPYGDLDVPVTLNVWAPVAAGAPLNGITPVTVTFTGSITNGTGSYTYDWDFGDGSPHSTALSPSHIYNVGGNFVVTFTATDSWGHSAADNHLVVHVTESTTPVVYNLYDDAGRARACVNRLTGSFTWMFPAATPATTWTGTAKVMNGGAKFVNFTGAPVILNITIDPVKHKASGYAISGGVYSQLNDINTTNNPPGCF